MALMGLRMWTENVFCNCGANVVALFSPYIKNYFERYFSQVVIYPIAHLHTVTLPITQLGSVKCLLLKVATSVYFLLRLYQPAQGNLQGSMY